MDRRHLLGLTVLIIGMFVLSGTALAAHKTHHKRAKTVATAAAEAPACDIYVEPSSFIDQGEFTKASSIATFVSVECEPVYAEKTVTLSSQELFDRCNGNLKWGYPSVTGASATVTLDDDGNGGTVVFGGPSCAAGESLVTAELNEAPYSTVTTAFTVLPPQVTEPGLFLKEPIAIEGAEASEAGTIVEVEFPPVFAEQDVNISAAELFHRCQGEPHLIWLGEEGELLAEDEPAVEGVKLDNDGNAYVVVLGVNSCAAGPSLIEASLEKAPYTTYTGTFTIEPPVVTFKP